MMTKFQKVEKPQIGSAWPESLCSELMIERDKEVWFIVNTSSGVLNRSDLELEVEF